MDEQITFCWSAERPQSPFRGHKEHSGILGGKKWRQRLRIQPSEELQLQQVGVMAPVISSCCSLFQLSLKKVYLWLLGLPKLLQYFLVFFLWKLWWASLLFADFMSSLDIVVLSPTTQCLVPGSACPHRQLMPGVHEQKSALVYFPSLCV